jgi:3-oxoacyl-[acyl-carrier-protein] synthase III
MSVIIKDISIYLPSNILSNMDLLDLFPDWNAAKIEERVGIRERHIADENETALDMAEQACNLLLQKHDKDQIDFLIFCTQSADYYLPTNACILQDRLGLKTSTGAYDFTLGCSGFVYGLAMAKAFIETGMATQVLLVTSDTITKYINPNDSSNRPLFGDAASASLIVASEKDGIKNFVLGTDGKGRDKLIIEAGASRMPLKDGKTYPLVEGVSPEYFSMNGPELFIFTIESVPKIISDVLAKNHLQKDDIDYFIFHQANTYMLNYLRKKIGIPPEKFYLDMQFVGNTSSTTIPLALRDSIDKNLIKPGNRILLCGFGVGYSWGATIIEIN